MSKKPVIIIGNGGHAKVLMDILHTLDRKIIGFTAPEEEINCFGIPYIGKDTRVFTFQPDQIELVNAIGSISSTAHRKSIFDIFRSKNYTFATLKHPGSIIAASAEIGEGVQIMAGAIIQPFAKVDDNTIINTSASIDHDCHIGKHCHVSPGVVLSGNVLVEEGTHIGMGTKIIQNIKIGKNVLIGAGSLILRDIPNNKKVFGTPAKEVNR